MRTVVLPTVGTIAAWRTEARELAAQGVPPEAVLWRVGHAERDLFADVSTDVLPASAIRLNLPREAVRAIETALCHSDPERFARAYALVLRLARKDLRWGDRSDRALNVMLQQEKAVRRDIHKMHAFVRFREVGDPKADRRAFAAWFEPDHPIVEAATPFFAKRFADMDWIIATPTLTARFENGELSFADTETHERPPEDATEDLWRTYFSNIFNPARLMVRAMTSEMPRKYWKNLPEAPLIPHLIRTAPERAWAMQAALPTEPHMRTDKIRPAPKTGPEAADITLETLKPALDACRRCPIGACATQGVAGVGPSDARLMIVGEQPGDQEDIAGRPFVGPAGQLFALHAAATGLDTDQAYVTNAVKHFKFRASGKRRIHDRPNAGEVSKCIWWLDLERRTVAPDLILGMGATAALALTGNGTGINTRRGQIETAPDGTSVLLTYHPSYLLRIRDAGAQAEATAQFVDDLTRARDWLAG